MRSLLVTISLLGLSLGCAEEGNSDASDSSGAPQAVVISSGAAKGDLSSASEYPELMFSKEGGVTLSRELYAGELLSVQYDLSRATECEAKGRGYLRHLTGFYQIDDQPSQAFEYPPSYTTSNRPQTTLIEVPEGKQLALWFYIVDTNGCELWDSNLGQNYLIPIAQRGELEQAEESRLVFHADGELSQQGALIPGERFTVEYDIARLNECESAQGGLPQWGITGHLKTNMSEERRFQVTQSVDGELRAPELSLEVPEGDTLYLWFTATNRYGCYQEDKVVTFELR